MDVLLAQIASITLCTLIYLTRTNNNKHTTTLITSYHSIHTAIQPLLQRDVLGIDAEWTHQHGKRQPVALIQLATSTHCVLVRLHPHLPFPQVLADILGNPAILKVGVGVYRDLKHIHKDYGISVAGGLDLRYCILKFRPNYKGPQSLKGLAFEICDIVLDKDKDIQCGNWNVPKLSKKQQQYAAMDAFASYKIFEALTGNCDDIDSVLVFVDTKFRAKAKQENNNNFRSGKNRKGLANGDTKSQSRKRKLYDNCRILAPDGELICTCFEKKVKWYLDRDLAVLISEKPFITIQLKFEPAGRGYAGQEFYLIEKKNQCVVCSESSELSRHSIVPPAFKKHLHVSMKMQHDIVLLCQKCREKALKLQEELTMLLAAEADIDPDSYIVDRSGRDLFKAARGACKALTGKNAHKIPQDRINHLWNFVAKYWERYDLETLENFPTFEKENVSLRTVLRNLLDQSIPDFILGEEVTMEKAILRCRYQSPEDQFLFVRRCRQVFVSTLDPKYMPELWSLDHRDVKW